MVGVNTGDDIPFSPEPPDHVDDHCGRESKGHPQDTQSAGDHADPLAEMFNGAWLDSQQFPPLEYAVAGIIPEGFGLLVAPPKAGKSWLVCGIGLSCAAGWLALERIRVDKRPVLYLALEDGPRRLQSRSRSLMRGEPIPAGIHFVTKAKPTEVIPMITEFMVRHPGDKPLIVVDTLGKARPPRPAGADLYAWDYAIGTQLKNTIDATPGSSLLVVHHTRKTESSDFVDSVSGSQGIAGSADFVVVLARKRHSDQAVLNVTGRDVAEAEYALAATDGLWRLDGTTLADARQTAQTRRESGRLGDRALEVLAFVNARSETRPADVAKALGLDPKQAGEVLGRLFESGAIHRPKRGVYVRTSTAESAESAENHDSAPDPFPAPPAPGAEKETATEQSIPHFPHFPHPSEIADTDEAVELAQNMLGARVVEDIANEKDGDVTT